MKTLIKNGLLYDGTGRAPIKGDLLLDGDRIAQLGGAIDAPADCTIDAEGLMVCPGLIDAHSHNDFFADRADAERFFRPFLCQGITTQITGNCSFSPFGMDADTPYPALLGGGLFEAQHPGSFADFCARVAGKLHVNLVPLIGQGSVRAGIAGYDPKPLSAAQRERELDFVREAMEGGAFGGSMGFMYEPDRYADAEECRAFAAEIARFGGILTVHPRACSAISADYPLLSAKSHLELGLEEVIGIAKASGVKVEYSHLIFAGARSWKLKDKMLAAIYKARSEGVDIAYDNYAFHYGASVITVVYPEWYAQLSAEEARRPLNRLRLQLTILIYRKALGIEWDDMVVAYISEEHRAYEGRTVAEIAAAEGLAPLDAYLKLVALSERRGRIYLGKYYNADIVRTLMQDELSVFMTDAWVEEKGLQNIAAYQTFPQFFLLARRAGIPAESVVRKMTGAAADRFGIPQRGYLREGYRADVTVLDPNALSVDESRPDAQPGGVVHVFVNGGAVVSDGVYVGGTHGALVLKPSAK